MSGGSYAAERAAYRLNRDDTSHSGEVAKVTGHCQIFAPFLHEQRLEIHNANPT
jgi:hypothetical protein